MQVADQIFESLNHGKAKFDDIYIQSDPREYYRVLCGLDYVIPDLAKNIFRSLIGHCADLRGRRVKVVDVGCSYGINAALIRFPLDIERLVGRYTDPQVYALSPKALISLDEKYFQAWPELVDADFVGLDSSAAAVSYAEQVGLIEAGVTSNLEKIVPVPNEIEHLQDADILISTGCVGYITQKTFQRILTLQQRGAMPWIINFVLRMFPFDPISRELENYDLVTEKLDGVTFIQRRFRSEDEFASTIAALGERGIDPEGKEAQGLLHAELFVSRPAADVEMAPLSELISLTSGGDRSFGRRYRRIDEGQIKLMR